MLLSTSARCVVNGTIPFETTKPSWLIYSCRSDPDDYAGTPRIQNHREDCENALKGNRERIALPQTAIANYSQAP